MLHIFLNALCFIDLYMWMSIRRIIRDAVGALPSYALPDIVACLPAVVCIG